MARRQTTLLPFLYPFLYQQPPRARNTALRAARQGYLRFSSRWQSTANSLRRSSETPALSESSITNSHLNPLPDDYSRFIFQDKCQVTIYAGSGGNGCVSFLREKYIEDGPANGGDGGTGGNIYIQAVEGMTSLHKLARRGVIKAGRGKNGQGKSKGGQRGHDVLIQVPVGTVVREVGRYDPVEEQENQLKELMAQMEEEEALEVASSRRDRWVLYPGSQPSDFLTMTFPNLGPPRRSSLAAMEPQGPIHLDLSQHMDQPMLLAAGAVGGFGNPHFVSRSVTRPKYATKGEGGMRLDLAFELKLLADVGLVGKPNAGKSTLLRSLTNSRTRIGNWEFTTLSPNIGTVVIDNFKGRPLVATKGKTPRTNFTIADIPGLVEDAHLDRGLGLGFLRHIERARILAFVVDLSTEDAVEALKRLWHELGRYEQLREEERSSEAGRNNLVNWSPFGEDMSQVHINEADDEESLITDASSSSVVPLVRRSLPPLALPPIHTKPWFVVATKADLPETQKNFLALSDYLSRVQGGTEDHPSGHEHGWKENLHVVPVSAMRGEGVNGIPKLVVDLMED
ncbi:GTP-binding protein Obg [Paecilomyces variotii No. 5]|uniref:GTP-binding protein Obg n=1 Tax=Byssochlamys spectabilis (strain No. 5 / NBRC 109023) TaxID=1356009 RepID=V5GB41_BYSSN|nr:GTP-binding protein Obg [Paecilomyces variotii No. 5]